MHYDLAVACRDMHGAGAREIAAHTRTLVERFTAVGKRCVIFIGAPMTDSMFTDRDHVDIIVVGAPAWTPYATLTDPEIVYSYALCEAIIGFLKIHSIRVIEFPDFGAEGYFFINHNLVHRRIPSACVRLHAPSFLINDDNENSACSLGAARVLAAEQEAMQRADHLLYGTDAMLERILDYFPREEASALKTRSVKIPRVLHPLSPTPIAPAIGHPVGARKKIGCLVPLEFRRGADLLVSNANRYLERHPESPLQFHLVGEDTPTAGGESFFAYLQRLIPPAINDRFVVRCVPAHAPPAESQPGEMDAFIFPARFDNHPAALDAVLPLRRPTFVSLRGGMAELADTFPWVKKFDPLERADWTRVFDAIDNDEAYTTDETACSCAMRTTDADIVAAYDNLKPTKPPAASPVRLSVVIAHFDDAENLTQLLRTLHQSETTGQLEVIVVDDGSTPEVLASLRAEFPAVALLHTPHNRSGPFLARRLGAEHATCDYIAFVDADDMIDVARYLHYAHTLAHCDRLDVLIPAMRHFGRENHASLPPPKSKITALFECYIHTGLIGRKPTLLKAFADASHAAHDIAHNEDWILGISLLFTGARVTAVPECAYFYNRTRDNSRSFSNAFRQWHSTASRTRHFDQCVERALSLGTLAPFDLKILRLVSLGMEPPAPTPPLRPRSTHVPWHTHFYRGFKALLGDRFHIPQGTPTPSRSLRPKLLFITEVMPNPEGNGPARRSHSVITALAQTHDVFLLTITHASLDDAAPPALPAGCRDWRRIPSHAGQDRELRRRRHLAGRHPRLFTWLSRQPVNWRDHSRARLRLAAEFCAGEEFDVIHAFRMVMAPYALAVRRVTKPRILSLDTDDVESTTLGRIAALHRMNREARPAAEQRSHARVHARLEQKLFPRFDRVFVCSQAGASRLSRIHGNIRILPNVVPAAPVQPQPRTAPGFRFLFIGTLDYYPNMDAVSWLCREILPRLRAACDCELRVAGLNAGPALINFLANCDGVRFCGAVATSAEAFASADALLVPLRAGGGTRLKILEAFAHGRPVVSTSQGIEGIEARPGEHVLLADTPDVFVREAARLATDADLRHRLASKAFELVSRDYSPQTLSHALANNLS